MTAPTAPQTLAAFHVEQLEAVQQRSHVAAPPDSFTVRVTEEDGLLGVRRNAFDCRLARAIRRALTLLGYRPTSVSVGSTHHGYSVVSVFFGVGVHRMYRFDPGDQITAYDCGGNPPPCTVTLSRLP